MLDFEVSPEQMFRILREAEHVPAGDVAQRHGIDVKTIETWRRELGSAVGWGGNRATGTMAVTAGEAEGEVRARRSWRDAVLGAVALAHAQLRLRGTRLGAGVRSGGGLVVRGPAGISVADRTAFLGGPVPTVLDCADGAEIVMGTRCVFDYGVRISAGRSVRIGTRCRFGPLVQVRDNRGSGANPVVIGDDVWLARGATVEPGASIGDGSVVAAGACVVASVPTGSLAFGSPAVWTPLRPWPKGRPHAASREDSPSEPTRDEVRAAIVAWFDDTRLFGEAASVLRSDSTLLHGSGLLDSLGTVQLVTMLERRFGVTLDRAEILARPGAHTLGFFIERAVGAAKAAPPGRVPG